MAGSEATLTNIRESLALDQITAERLRDRGIETIEQLASTTVDELVDLIDISLDEANSILEKSRRLLAQKQAREARAQREAAESGPAEENVEQHAASIELDASAAIAAEPAEVPESGAAAPQEQSGAEGVVDENAVPDELPADEAAEQAAHEVQMEHHEGPGPMPRAGLEAQAPGAAVVPESHAEWRDHVEEEEKNNESADESESEGD
jgi:hypothetical protein